MSDKENRVLGYGNVATVERIVDSVFRMSCDTETGVQRDAVVRLRTTEGDVIFDNGPPRCVVCTAGDVWSGHTWAEVHRFIKKLDESEALEYLAKILLCADVVTGISSGAEVTEE